MIERKSHIKLFSVIALFLIWFQMQLENYRRLLKEIMET